MRSRHIVALLAVLAGVAVPVSNVRHAAAHAVIQAGGLSVAIGWLHEPAYVGVPNAVQVVVKDATGSPVTGLGDRDLHVTVSLGTATAPPQPLLPGFDSDTGLGLRGEYEAALIPTAPGNYTFHVTGRIAGATPIDQTITASDQTFAPVTEQAAADFPTTVPAVGDVSQRVDALGTRIDGAATAAAANAGAVAAAQSAADDARRTGDRALVVGIVALALGAGLAVAGLVTVIRSRRGRTRA